MRYRGREFTDNEINDIRRLIASTGLLRSPLSRLICEQFGWRTTSGGLKDASCRAALVLMERDGHIQLPRSRKCRDAGRGNAKPWSILTEDCEPPTAMIEGALAQLGKITLITVATTRESHLWNELVDRYHYLGYRRTPGAQVRYLVRAGDGKLLGCFGFGAAAWKLKPRDLFIGWDPSTRERNLHRVVNNGRFLILPWVRVKNLASHLLSRAIRQLPIDWGQRYGYQPVALETFVDVSRYRGTCYRAGNWAYLGQTQGRGRYDRNNERAQPVKGIFIYPLTRHFREVLTT
jgi:hypothetical protein